MLSGLRKSLESVSGRSTLYPQPSTSSGARPPDNWRKECPAFWETASPTRKNGYQLSHDWSFNSCAPTTQTSSRKPTLDKNAQNHPPFLNEYGRLQFCHDVHVIQAPNNCVQATPIAPAVKF